MSVPSKKIQRKKKTPLRDYKVWLFKQCETVVSFWGWDCTFGQEQEDWSGGRGHRITLKNDFSCIWQVGTSCRWRKAILQYQKGMFPIVLIACCWWHTLTSPSSLALKQGELSWRAGFLYTPRKLRPFLCITLRGWWHKACGANVQTSMEDALPCKGMVLVKVLGQPKWSVPLPSGEGLTRTRIIS